jgi:hypothetical protein
LLFDYQEISSPLAISPVYIDTHRHIGESDTLHRMSLKLPSQKTCQCSVTGELTRRSVVNIVSTLEGDEMSC